jgi:hypothetical protein
MKHKILLLCTLLLVLGIVSLQAQEALSASGGESSGSGGSSSYSVGQVFSNTSQGTSGSISEGVQQAFEILVISGIKETGISLNISAYPNPTHDFLHLEVDASTLLNMQTMRYQLFDMNGRLIASDRIVGNVTTIVTTQLNPATYFVKVLSGNQEVKTFKIIKY